MITFTSLISGRKVSFEDHELQVNQPTNPFGYAPGNARLQEVLDLITSKLKTLDTPEEIDHFLSFN